MTAGCQGCLRVAPYPTARTHTQEGKCSKAASHPKAPQRTKATPTHNSVHTPEKRATVPPLLNGTSPAVWSVACRWARIVFVRLLPLIAVRATWRPL